VLPCPEQRGANDPLLRVLQQRLPWEEETRKSGWTDTLYP